MIRQSLAYVGAASGAARTATRSCARVSSISEKTVPATSTHFWRYGSSSLEPSIALQQSIVTRRFKSAMPETRREEESERSFENDTKVLQHNRAQHNRAQHNRAQHNGGTSGNVSGTGTSSWRQRGNAPPASAAQSNPQSYQNNNGGKSWRDQHDRSNRSHNQNKKSPSGASTMKSQNRNHEQRQPSHLQRNNHDGGPKQQVVVGRIERQQLRDDNSGSGTFSSPNNRSDTIPDARRDKIAQGNNQKNQVDDSFERLRKVFLTRPDPSQANNRRPQGSLWNDTASDNDSSSFRSEDLVRTLQETSRHLNLTKRGPPPPEVNYQEAFLSDGKGDCNDHSSTSSWRNAYMHHAQNGGGYNNSQNNRHPAGRHPSHYTQGNAYSNDDNRYQQQTRRGPRATVVEQPKIASLPLHATSIPLASLAEMTRTSIAKLVRVVRDLGEEVTLEDGKTKKAGFVRSLNKQARRNVAISIDAAELVAMELGFEVRRQSEDENDYDLLLNMDVNASLLDEEEVLLHQMELEEQAAGGDTAAEAAFSEDRYESRPPVVCIMGHVDHGKTTLMDALRQFAAKMGDTSGEQANTKKSKKKKKGGKANNKNADQGVPKVAGTEAGGITQVISAFQVSLPAEFSALENEELEVPAMPEEEISEQSKSSATVTFLDTPGHAAFSKMRHCGMYATDVLVLVIAADDGLREQTKEIIELYQTQSNKNLKLVVAMTKIDKVGSDSVSDSRTNIENELLSHGIETEGVGGSIPIVPVSGITSEGVEELVRVLAQRGQGLMWDTSTEEGMGVVLDARVERGLGVVVDCVVRTGQFIKSGHVVVERQDAKIRLLKDVHNKSVDVAHPSQPIRIVGLNHVPKAGEAILCVSSEERASEIVEKREDMYIATTDQDETNMTATTKRPEREYDPIANLEITNGKTAMHRKRALQRFGLIDKTATGEDVLNAEAAAAAAELDTDGAIRIPVIIKADADGTLHAIESALFGVAAQSRHTIMLDPIKCGVGPINASDIILASESNAPIIGFNVHQDKNAATTDQSKGVKMLKGKIIYSILDEAKEIFAEYLPAILTDKIHGRATVQAVFQLTGKKEAVVAGCQVIEGRLLSDKTDNGSRVAYRVLREGEIVAGGKTSDDSLRASALKKFKENVTEIKRGEECGLSLVDFGKYEEGDIVECFTTEETRSF